MHAASKPCAQALRTLCAPSGCAACSPCSASSGARRRSSSCSRGALGVQRMLEDGFSRAGKNLVQVWPGADRRGLHAGRRPPLALVHVRRRRRRAPARDARRARRRRSRGFWCRSRYGQRALNARRPRRRAARRWTLRGVTLAAGRGRSRADDVRAPPPRRRARRQARARACSARAAASARHPHRGQAVPGRRRARARRHAALARQRRRDRRAGVDPAHRALHARSAAPGRDDDVVDKIMLPHARPAQD